MTIAIVEDYLPDQADIEAWIRRFWVEQGKSTPLSVEIYTSGDAFIAALAHGRFSLVLMDCRMEGADGIAAARALRACDGEAVLIFTTSSRDYAVDGYQVSAAGYLVKPFSYEDFARTLSRVWRWMPGRRVCLNLPDTGEKPVFLDQIIYCDMDKHYAQIHLAGPKVLRVRISFSKLLEQLLPHPCFLLCYRGCVINLDHAQKMDEMNFFMDTGERVPFRKKEHTKLMRLYADYLYEKTRRENPWV